MMNRKEKEAFVKNLASEIAGSKTIAIMPLANLPDRLLQKARNQMKGKAKFVITRRSLVERALGDKKQLFEKYLQGNFALILSSLEPLQLYQEVSANKLSLPAKPGQITPIPIAVKAGETNVQPGQAVTELKAAGLDVQIQKNKVVIAKDKVLVEAGKKVSAAVANALRLLDIKPFEVSTSLVAAYADGILFTKEALSITSEQLEKEIARIFAEANALSTGIGFVTPYNVSYFIAKAYNEAIAVGLAGKVPEPEILERLVAQAAAEANNINSLLNKNNA